MTLLIIALSVIKNSILCIVESIIVGIVVKSFVLRKLIIYEDAQILIFREKILDNHRNPFVCAKHVFRNAGNISPNMMKPILSIENLEITKQ